MCEIENLKIFRKTHFLSGLDEEELKAIAEVLDDMRKEMRQIPDLENEPFFQFDPYLKSEEYELY